MLLLLFLALLLACWCQESTKLARWNTRVVRINLALADFAIVAVLFRILLLL